MSKGIPSDWRVSALETSVRLITDGAHASPPTCENGRPIATVQNMRSRTIDVSSCRLISENDFNALIKGNCSPEIDDVLFSKDGTVGKTFVYRQRDKIVLLSSIAIIRLDKDKLDPEFCSQFLLSPLFYSELENTKSGSAIRRIVLNDLKKIELPTPPLPEQKKIAAILSSVDEVIEKTRAQIDKLKDLKTGMMQELLTKGVGHTEFKDSPVGRIPAGWNVVLMDSICKKITDGEHQTPKRSAHGYYLLSARNIRDGYIALENVDFIDTSEYQRISKRVEPQEGDILISCSGSIGRTAIVPKKLKFSMVRSVAILQPKRDLVDSQYLAHQISSPLIQTQIEKSLSQLAQANLFQAPIKALNVILPPMTEQIKIAQVVNSLVEVINEKAMKLNRANSLKKALMQDLLTGKVRVQVDTRELAKA